MKALFSLFLFTGISCSAFAQLNLELGFRTGLSHFEWTGRDLISNTPDGIRPEEDLYLRKECKKWAFENSISHSAKHVHDAGYAYIYDADNYFYDINEKSNRFEWNHCVEYNIVRNKFIKNYVGLNATFLYSHITHKESNVIDNQQKDVYHHNYTSSYNDVGIGLRNNLVISVTPYLKVNMVLQITSFSHGPDTYFFQPASADGNIKFNARFGVGYIL